MSKRPKSKVQYGTPAPTQPVVASSLAPKIALGAVALIAVVAIVIAAVKDGSSSKAGIDPKLRVAFQPVNLKGTNIDPFPDGGDAVPATDPAIGKDMPVISGKTFDGTTVDIKPNGKPQLIVIAAHWCPHCQAEVPLLVEWMKSGIVPTKKIDVTLISTAAEEIKGNYPPASWLAKEEWNRPVLVDDQLQAAMTAFGATGFPTLVAIDKDGKIARRGSGELTVDQVQQLVNAAIGAADTTSTTAAGATANTTPKTSPAPTTNP